MKMESTPRFRGIGGLLKVTGTLAALVSVLSCTTVRPTTQDLMKTPELLESRVVNPYSGTIDWIDEGERTILYATARKPAPSGAAVPYLNERDSLLHLGQASISVMCEDIDWDGLQDVDAISEFQGDIPLSLKGIEDFGPLDDTLHALVDPDRLEGDLSAPSTRFMEELNGRLKDNPVRDITIYVHGVNTAFETPILFSAEFWHFSGYRGVPVAFSWASTQNLLDYVSDVDTAEYTSSLFRNFLEYLMRESDAENIHIIAYSAGTKLVSQALHQIGLVERAGGEVPGSEKIGRVFYIAGDVERQLIGLYAADGLLDTVDSLTVYMSSTDMALKASKSIRKYPRVGQTWSKNAIPPDTVEFFREAGVSFIDVTGLEGSHGQNGHGYFRTSPKVSSDLLAAVGPGLTPERRGLEYDPENAYWIFPKDYILRLQTAMWESNLPTD